MFSRFFSGANEFYHTAQLDAFFTWLALKKFTKSFFVSVNLPLQQEILNTHRKKTSQEGKICGFIIFQTNKHTPGESWHRIWYAQGIEIWENKDIHHGALPLRFGLSISEKKELLEFARATMQSFFNGDNNVSRPNIPEHLASEKTVLDVGIWIDGQMRGSIISPALPLADSLQYASRGTLRDPRMKPVEPDELERAQIEITLMSDLVLPLREHDMGEKIDACRGYYVEKGKKGGWYLPMVHNCTKFKDMSVLKSSLIKEKAGIVEEGIRIPLYAFQTEGWIEDGNKNLMLFKGPVAYAASSIKRPFLDRVKIHGDTAAEWLINMCDEYGAMPLYIDPLYQRTGRMDWGRLAHASYALAAFGVATKHERCIRTSEKISRYIERYLFGGGTACYLLHAYLERGDDLPASLIEQLRTHPVESTMHPIISATCSSLFARLALTGERSYEEKSMSLAEEVFADFKSKKSVPGTQLALYPELIYTFKLLHSFTRQSLYLKKSEEVTEWLISQQLSNGSFPIFRNSSFAYTRGTGKIFEVLALYPDRYGNAIEKSFEWLVRMQYTEDSLYFVDHAFRKRVIGGFRHDHANAEAWIDASAHFLIGSSRLLCAGQTPVDK